MSTDVMLGNGGHMRYERNDGVSAERSGERTVVLNTDGSTLITLSPVGTLVWEGLPNDRSGLLNHLAETFPDTPRTVLEDDLDRFLAELLEGDLITELDAAG